MMPTPSLRTDDVSGALWSAALVLLTFGAPLVTAASQDASSVVLTMPRTAPERAPVVMVLMPETATPEVETADEPEPAPTIRRRAAPEPEPEPEPEIEERFETVASGRPAPAEPETEATAETKAPSRRKRTAARPDRKPSLRTLLTKAQTASAPSRPDRRPRKRRTCDYSEPGIVQLDDHTWEVERALIKEHTRTIKKLNALGWSHAWRDDDQGVRGWRIGGFGCRSPLHAGGLRHKDVVRSVNGRRTNTVLQLIGLWTTWGRTDTFEVVVWRRGEEVVLRYKMV